MIINNIDFCIDVNALLYTIHPGFLSHPSPSVDLKNKNYDFQFLDNTVVNNKKGYETMILSLKKIANYASSNKMKLAIETQGSLQKKDFLLMQRPIEFKKLFSEIPNNIYINLNLAHTYFASLSYRFSIIKFIKFIESKVEAVELSCNDGIHDQHLPIKANSKNLNFLKYLKNKPIILEFRNCNLSTLNKSINFLNANI
jgi:sugar phosphate isomerase/epimerase